MTRMIRAISIDPFACTVNPVEFDADDYTNIYPLLSHPVHPVETFTTARIDILKAQDTLLVDDNGLLGDPVRFFQMAGCYEPFAGKGLILGADNWGESISCTTSIDLVRVSVIFLQRFGDGLVQASRPYDEML